MLDYDYEREEILNEADQETYKVKESINVFLISKISSNLKVMFMAKRKYNRVTTCCSDQYGFERFLYDFCVINFQAN